MSDWREFVQSEIKRLHPNGLDDSFWDDCTPEDEAPSLEESLEKNWQDTIRDYFGEEGEGIMNTDRYTASGCSRCGWPREKHTSVTHHSFVAAPPEQIQAWRQIPKTRQETGWYWVTSIPEVRGGEPCVRGTRVPAADVAGLLEDGVEPIQIHDFYPGITADAARSVLAWWEQVGRDESFAGCAHTCRPRGQKWAHTYKWGECEWAEEPPAPKPIVGGWETFVAGDGELSVRFAGEPVESRIEYGYRTPSGPEFWDEGLTRTGALQCAESDPDAVALQRTVYVGPTQEITP